MDPRKDESWMFLKNKNAIVLLHFFNILQPSTIQILKVIMRVAIVTGNTVTSEEEGTQIVSNILRKTTTEKTINRHSQMKEKRVQLRQVKKMRHQHHHIRTDTMKVTIHTSLIAAVTVNSICFTRMRDCCRVNLMTKNTLKLIPTTAKHCWTQ